MKILFISQLFDPENSIKGLEFLKTIKNLGHDIEVITSFPSYPHGKIYNGFRQKLIQRENHDGVKVIRLPTFISHGGVFKRLLSYISFGISAIIYGSFFSQRPNVIYAYYPPMIVGFVAYVIGWLRKAPFIYDVQDLWPDALIALKVVKPNTRLDKLLNNACNFIYKKSEMIVVLSDGYKDLLIQRGVPEKKIVRIFNWCDEKRLNISEVGIPPFRLCDKYFNIVYAGNLGQAQALEYIIETASIVNKQKLNRVRFSFIGSGICDHELRELTQKLCLPNVDFYPHVPPEKLSSILYDANVLLVHLKSDPVFKITIPQKTQAYMYLGRPILMAADGDAAEIIRDSKGGIISEPCKPDKIASVICQLLSLKSEDLQILGKNGHDYYQQKMSATVGVMEIHRTLLATDKSYQSKS